jgi:hypothetical protein
MEAAEIGSILVGAVVALGGTLIAQWSNLAYQTRRQREARRADFQRSALVRVWDGLLELNEALEKVRVAGNEAAMRGDEASIDFERNRFFHPTVEAVRTVCGRVRILSAALEDEVLRLTVHNVVNIAESYAAMETKDRYDSLREQHSALLDSLGRQLRNLP